MNLSSDLVVGHERLSKHHIIFRDEDPNLDLPIDIIEIKSQIERIHLHEEEDPRLYAIRRGMSHRHRAFRH